MEMVRGAAEVLGWIGGGMKVDWRVEGVGNELAGDIRLTDEFVGSTE